MTSQPQIYRFGSNRGYLLAAIGTLLTYTLDGPLRYALQLVSAESLLYLRDVVAVVVIAMVGMSWIAGQTLATPLVAVLAVLFMHTFVALLSLPSAFQALFGLKIFLPFLLGFAVAPFLPHHKTGLVRLAALVFATTAAGVALNAFVDFPWIGADYDTAFGTTSAAKQWWATGGALRLPGFARASFSAASIMLVSLVPLLSTRTSLVTKLLLLGVTGFIVVLTTSKGGLLALAALSLDCLVAYGIGVTVVANGFLLGLALVCLALPLISVQIAAGSQRVPDWFGSFMERVSDMWPNAFGLFDHPLQLLWGRGLGGIGTAQMFDEWSRLNAADNLMVYLLVACGIFGIAYIGLFLLKLLRYLQALPATDLMFRCSRGWTIVLLTYGLTANMIEEASVSLSMGVVFGLAFGVSRSPAAVGFGVRATSAVPVA